MKEIQKFRFKISVVGDSQVGKTTLMNKYTKGSLSKDYSKTFGVKVSMFDSEIDGNMIRLLFWDIAGRNDYYYLRPHFYKKTCAAILVFSLEDNQLGKESFNHILKWYKEVLKNCGEIPIYIFANKVDLVDENKLDKSIIGKLIEENNIRNYYLTSAISGDNVIMIFKEISEELYKNYEVLHSEL